MQTVTQAWKNNQRQYLVSESFIEILLNIGDPESQGDARASDNGSVFYGDTAAVVQRKRLHPERYATLEKNFWRLDGRYKIVPDNSPYGDNGYIGSYLTDANGNYTNIPTLTISFSKLYDALIPGITINWADAYEEYATKFRVTAYNGSTVVAQRLIENNQLMMTAVNMDIINYDRIVIQILQWCKPYRRPRISRVLIGIEQIYTKSDMMSYSHTMDVDLVSAILPKAEVQFELVDIDGKYYPGNHKGLGRFLMSRQEITVQYGYKLGPTKDDIEWIPAGIFFMSEWEAPQNGIKASFTARDVFELLTDPYTGPTTGNLYNIAEQALIQADLPYLESGNPRYTIDNSLKSILAASDAKFNDGTTIAEVLQYVANAACCVLYQDREGMLWIKPYTPPVATDYPIDTFNSYANSDINLTKILKSVDINNGAYVLNVNRDGETQTVNNPLISTGRAPIVAQWIANVLKSRKIFSGNYRADPRLDTLDLITNENRFETAPVIVTSIQYTYNGAFRGDYEGREKV